MTPRHPCLSVLVVDDSAIVRQRLREFLVETCQLQHVREAANGTEAWALFKQLRPDAVLLDIHLPDNRGFELLCRIKGAAPSCPVIVLTNVRESVFRHETERRGADHFLHKATEFEHVAELLHRYAARSVDATSKSETEEAADPFLP